MTAQETLATYSKWDYVEKTFKALKSCLVMDDVGVSNQKAMHGKDLACFGSSNLYMLIFSHTRHLRVTDKNHYSVPSMIEHLAAIKADKNLTNGKRKRRYNLTHRQESILRPWKNDKEYINQKIVDFLERTRISSAW